MPVRQLLHFVGPIISITCLGVGFTTTGLWVTAFVVVFSLLVWLFTIKWPFEFQPSWALVISVSLAAAGLLAGAKPLFMLISATFALAGWDSVLWNRDFITNSLSTPLTLIERKHYQSLALALGLGVLTIIAGRLIRIQIPFVWMVVLVILALFSLERIWHALKNRTT